MKVAVTLTAYNNNVLYYLFQRVSRLDGFHSIIMNANYIIRTTASVEECWPEFPRSLHDKDEIDWNTTENDGKGNHRRYWFCCVNYLHLKNALNLTTVYVCKHDIVW